MFKKTNSVLAVLSYALLMWCCGSLGFNVQHRYLWLFVAAVVASLVLTWQFVRAVKESHRGTPSLSHAFMSNPFLMWWPWCSSPSTCSSFSAAVGFSSLPC